jgi:short subunit dehydrogenase-like uncharacterized protein
MADRDYDIVLLGATGYTGGLTADYLHQHAPEGTRWALAGRNRDKLAGVAERLGADVPLVTADVTDEASLRSLAESTHVVITTVGPYLLHGEPLVAACSKAGTDYVDLTGEPEFVDLMYLRHHAAAEASGARIIHACGFDSIPHDLGAQFTVQQLPEGAPVEVRAYVRAGGKPSAGTFHSAIGAISRIREAGKVHKQRRAADPKPADGRRVRALKAAPHRVPDVGWALPMPTIDPQVVMRSATALERYGPDFGYGHFFAVKRAAAAAGVVGGLGMLAAAVQIPPARKFLLGRMASGDGPTEAERAKGWFNVRFVGEGGGQRVVTEVAGGDPGYGETAKMLAESALCLAADNLPETSGQVTTAVAMGDALRERLHAQGITFSVTSR